MKTKYDIKANQLALAIDIAIDAFKTHPPKGFEQMNIDHIVGVYKDSQQSALNPQPQYKNLQSLKYEIDNALIYFQEASGITVNYFWEQIRVKELPFKRENKLGSILKRKRIKNDLELDFVTDVLGPYQHEGLIGEEEVKLLNKLIIDFENKKPKN